jgi:uncharacterized small protein (DUF1192 family)
MQMQSPTDELHRLTKGQLIQHIQQLNLSYSEFTHQSQQVEELLQQQLDTCMQKLKTMDDLSLSQMNQFQDLQSKIIALETENDVLESTVRMLRSQLEASVEKHNECIERIAYLDNEIEWFKTELKSKCKSNAQTEAQMKDKMALTEKLEEWEAGWKLKEQSWADQLAALQKDLDDVTLEKTQLESQLKNHIQSTLSRTETHLELENLQKRNEDILLQFQESMKRNKIQAAKLKKAQANFAGIHRLSTYLKLKQKGLTRAYMTPALNDLA